MSFAWLVAGHIALDARLPARQIVTTISVWPPGTNGSVAEALNEQIVVLVYTERRKGPHIIPLRKAEKYEARYYIAEAKEFQG